MPSIKKIIEKYHPYQVHPNNQTLNITVKSTKILACTTGDKYSIFEKNIQEKTVKEKISYKKFEQYEIILNP